MCEDSDGYSINSCIFPFFEVSITCNADIFYLLGGLCLFIFFARFFCAIGFYFHAGGRVLLVRLFDGGWFSLAFIELNNWILFLLFLSNK